MSDESVLKGVLSPLLFSATAALKDNANFLNEDVGKFIAFLVGKIDFSSFNEHTTDVTLADLPYLETIQSVELFSSDPSKYFIGIVHNLLDVIILLVGELKLEILFETDIINSTLLLFKSMGSKTGQDFPSQICKQIGALGTLLLSKIIDASLNYEFKLSLSRFLLEFDAFRLFLSDHDIICLASVFWPASYSKDFSISSASEALFLLCRKKANLVEDFLCKALVACPSPLRIRILQSFYDKQEYDFAVLSTRPLMICVSFISDPVYAHLYEHVTELFGASEVYRFIDALMLSIFEILSRQGCAFDFGQLEYLFEALNILALDENASIVQALKESAKYPVVSQLLAKPEFQESMILERIDVGFILATQ